MAFLLSLMPCDASRKTLKVMRAFDERYVRVVLCFLTGNGDQQKPIEELYCKHIMSRYLAQRVGFMKRIVEFVGHMLDHEDGSVDWGRRSPYSIEYEGEPPVTVRIYLG